MGCSQNYRILNSVKGMRCSSIPKASYAWPFRSICPEGTASHGRDMGDWCIFLKCVGIQSIWTCDSNSIQSKSISYLLGHLLHSSTISWLHSATTFCDCYALVSVWTTGTPRDSDRPLRFILFPGAEPAGRIDAGDNQNQPCGLFRWCFHAPSLSETPTISTANFVQIDWLGMASGVSKINGPCPCTVYKTDQGKKDQNAEATKQTAKTQKQQKHGNHQKHEKHFWSVEAASVQGCYFKNLKAGGD